MKDIECPYCGEEQDICHDDGFGYAEDEAHHDECGSCEKAFVFYTSIHFCYSPRKADCLNGGEHRWTSSMTHPRRYTHMECFDCDKRRNPTEDEMARILNGERITFTADHDDQPT